MAVCKPKSEKNRNKNKTKQNQKEVWKWGDLKSEPEKRPPLKKIGVYKGNEQNINLFIQTMSKDVYSYQTQEL